jgi:putative heme iron utilization protein
MSKGMNNIGRNLVVLISNRLIDHAREGNLEKVREYTHALGELATGALDHIETLETALKEKSDGLHSLPIAP